MVPIHLVPNLQSVQTELFESLKLDCAGSRIGAEITVQLDQCLLDANLKE